MEAVADERPVLAILIATSTRTRQIWLLVTMAQKVAIDWMLICEPPMAAIGVFWKTFESMR